MFIFHPASVAAARRYVGYTLLANYWYSQPIKHSQSRGAFYDRLAYRQIKNLTDDEQAFARRWYHSAYDEGRSWRYFFDE